MAGFACRSAFTAVVARYARVSVFFKPLLLHILFMENGTDRQPCCYTWVTLEIWDLWVWLNSLRVMVAHVYFGRVIYSERLFGHTKLPFEVFHWHLEKPWDGGIRKHVMMMWWSNASVVHFYISFYLRCFKNLLKFTSTSLYSTQYKSEQAFWTAIWKVLWWIILLYK